MRFYCDKFGRFFGSGLRSILLYMTKAEGPEPPTSLLSHAYNRLGLCITSHNLYYDLLDYIHKSLPVTGFRIPAPVMGCRRPGSRADCPVNGAQTIRYRIVSKCKTIAFECRHYRTQRLLQCGQISTKVCLHFRLTLSNRCIKVSFGSVRSN